PTNNLLSNLKWGTYSENTQSAYDKGRKKPSVQNVKRFGSAHRQSKMIIQMDLQGNVISEIHGMKEAGRRTGIFFKCISDCCRGRSLTAGGFRWKYATL